MRPLPTSRIFLTPAFTLWAAVAMLPTLARAAIPPVEKLLPADTLVLATVPEFAKATDGARQLPLVRLWNDPAMKPFRDKFATKWDEEFIGGLERELGIKLADYVGLLQGQLTFAVTRDGWQGTGAAEPGMLLLLDARDKGDQLKTNLTTLRKKWTDAGKTVRTEKIRDVEFAILDLATNELPATIRQFFPHKQEIQELGKEPEKPSTAKKELLLGQFESLLMLGTSVKTLESVVAHLTGGNSPALSDNPAYEAVRLAHFREATGYLWLNTATYVEIQAKVPRDKPNPAVPNLSPLPDFDKIISGLGLSGLKSVAFTYRDQPEGALLELFLEAPESGRKGLFQLIAVPPKESGPPAFVPADVVKFQRWRLDGPKTIATFEKTLAEVSPQFLNTWNFLIQSGESAVQQTDPKYDLRKSIFGNLGDDVIAYEKAPRSTAPADLAAPPFLLAIGSPNPEPLSRALAGLLIIRSGDALSPKTREFLGRKIYSITLPVPGPQQGPSLQYVASGGYVAFSTDAAILEEFIRSAESPARPLRDTPGLGEAAQRVGGMGTGVFGYENEAESARTTFELLRKLPPTAKSSGDSNPVTAALPFGRPDKTLREWMDFSLLPDFAKVSHYFYIALWTGASDGQGISWKFFTPKPPGPK